MVIRELYVKLGITPDAASMAEAFSVVELLKKGLEVVAETANEAVHWLGEQVSATAEAGEAAELMSQRLGLSAKTTQELAYVGKLANVSLEDMQVGMRTLASKGVQNLQQGFLDLAERIKGTTSQGMKLALAQEFLGRSGQRLLPILNKGKEGIKELMAEAEKLGFVMSGEDIEAAKEYEESTKRLGAAFTGLRNSVILPLLKPLADLVSWMVKGVLAIRQWIKAGADLGGHLKSFGITLLIAAAGLVLYNLGAIAAAVTTGILTFNFLAAAEAAWAFVAGLWAAVWPIAAIVAGLGALYLVVDDVYTFIKGGDSIIGRALHKWLGPFKDWHEALSIIWTKVKDEFGTLWEDLKTIAVSGIKKIPGIEWLINTAAHARDSAADTVGDYLYGGGNAFKGGAASPAAAATVGGGSSKTTNVKIDAIHVNSQHGVKAEDIAGMIPQKIQEHMDRSNREAAAAAN